MSTVKTGYVEVNGARLYYEIAGSGTPLVMIHAGIADSRMWDCEFASFAASHRVLRFDMRGYGKSHPVPGDFNIQDDLTALLTELNVDGPLVLMGCSMGAGLALDFALANPGRTRALILVGGGPAGFEVEAEEPDELFAESERAFENGELERVAELDMQIWFDGVGRSPNPDRAAARAKALEMARRVTELEFKRIGNHVRKTPEKPAAERLHEITAPSLIVVGENDLPYLIKAADFMQERLPNATLATMADAAHLPNMEHPAQFRSIVEDFLELA